MRRARLRTAIAIGIAALISSSVGVGAQSEDRILDHLRAEPHNPVLFERAIRLLERGEGVAAAASRLAAQSESAADHELTGRLWQAAGRPALALVAFETAIEVEPPSALAYGPLCVLYVEAGWSERALQLWEQAALAAIPEALRLYVEYRLAYAMGKDDEAERIALTDSAIPLAERLKWSLKAGAHEHSAALYSSQEEWTKALQAFLAAGLWARALEIYEQHEAEIDDETAYGLARASGRAVLLDAHLGDRRDGAAERYRTRLGQSFGTEARPETSERKVDVVDKSTRPSPSQATALEVLESSEKSDGEAALRAIEGTAPSLLIAAAWLKLGDDMEARKELVRWRLEPNLEEQAVWLPRIERQRPSWFAQGSALERAQFSAVESVSLLREIDRALFAVEPGSTDEAKLLFHKGRLTQDQATLQRAAAIAPHALVQYPTENVRLTQPIRRALKRWTGEQWPPEVPTLSDLPLGTWSGRTVRRSRNPSPGRGTWSIESWTDDSAPPASPPSGVVWDENGVRFPNGKTWRAGLLAPVVGVIRLPTHGWLVIGRGAALFDRDAMLASSADTGLVWEYAMKATPNPAQIHSRLSKFASPGLLDFLNTLRPPRLPNWLVIREFLDGVRRRHRDPDIQIECFFRENGRGILRATSGERAVLVPRIVRRTTVPVPGFTQKEWGWLRPKLTPMPTARATQMPSELERKSMEKTRVPVRHQPVIDPGGPGRRAAQTKLPDAVGAPVAAAGHNPRVVVCGDGSVFCFDTDGLRWKSDIVPPLPGKAGFPTHPTPLPGHAPTDRGPHRAGPVADSRTPLIFLEKDHVYVCTDRCYQFSYNGGRRQIRLARPVKEIRDLAVDGNGQVWILPGDAKDVVSSARYISIPESGAFDLESVDGSLFVLGFERVEFWLRRIGIKNATSERISLPEMPMDRDRERLKISALGRWGSRLLLVHDKLYALDPKAMDWAMRVDWPGFNSHLFPFYSQSRPRVVGDTLYLARPWGVIESWSKKDGS